MLKLFNRIPTMFHSAVQHIELLSLDEKGYGPSGEHTRRSWRQACLDNLLAGPEVFNSWQQTWHDSAQLARMMEFDYKLHFEDGRYQVVKVFAQSGALDFVGQVLDEVDLQGLQVIVAAIFDAVSFDQAAWFEKSSFDEDVRFQYALFRAGASFAGVQFGQGVGFEHAHFLAKAHFNGVQCLGRASFKQTVFEGLTYFNAAKFSGETKLESAHFLQDVFFKQSVFAAASSFQSAQFDSDLICADVCFETDTNFESAQVKNKADFSGTQFYGVSVFKSVGFGQSVFFDHATFYQEALFQDESFDCDISFAHVAFNGVARFESAAFNQSANFTLAKFNENVSFDATQFLGTALFKQAHFACAAWFDSALFGDNVWFSQAKFKGNAWFKTACFAKHTGFDDVVFNEGINFENTSFDGVGHFEGARFVKQYPSFRGCAVDHTRLEFSDEGHFSHAHFSDEAIRNCAFLKQLSHHHAQIDQMLMFNAQELRAKYLNALAAYEAYSPTKRFMNVRWWSAQLTWLYEVLSDYGRSVFRPLVTYFVLMLVSFVLALMFAFNHPPKCGKQLSQWQGLSNSLVCQSSAEQLNYNAYRASFEYSVRRANGLLIMHTPIEATQAVNHRVFGQAAEPFGMRIWQLFKGTLSLIALILIALGLRNRYRLQ